MYLPQSYWLFWRSWYLFSPVNQKLAANLPYGVRIFAVKLVWEYDVIEYIGLLSLDSGEVFRQIGKEFKIFEDRGRSFVSEDALERGNLFFAFSRTPASHI